MLTPQQITKIEEQRRERIAHCVVWLSQFPVFKRRLPLKIGIHHALFSRAPPYLSCRTIRRTLSQWCADPLYLAAIAQPSAYRHDLDGAAVEPVSAAHREYAISVLREEKN